MHVSENSVASSQNSNTVANEIQTQNDREETPITNCNHAIQTHALVHTSNGSRQSSSPKDSINTHDVDNERIPVIFKSDVNMVSSKENSFCGYTRNRIDRYFVSGIRKSSTETGMREYMQDRGVHPTFIRFFRTQTTLQNPLN